MHCILYTLYCLFILILPFSLYSLKSILYSLYYTLYCLYSFLLLNATPLCSTLLCSTLLYDTRQYYTDLLPIANLYYTALYYTIQCDIVGTSTNDTSAGSRPGPGLRWCGGGAFGLRILRIFWHFGRMRSLCDLRENCQHLRGFRVWDSATLLSLGNVPPATVCQAKQVRFISRWQIMKQVMQETGVHVLNLPRPDVLSACLRECVHLARGSLNHFGFGLQAKSLQSTWRQHSPRSASDVSHDMTPPAKPALWLPTVSWL